MKKQFLSITATILTASALVFTGCSKDDVTEPEVTLNGGNQTVSLESTYVDPGATAKDNKDGDLTPTVSGTVDTKHAGTYTLTYSATDAAGNTGSASRTVVVKNDAEGLAGLYDCKITGASTYPQTITASSTKNGRIHFSKFGNYVNNIDIYCDVKGTDIYLPSQTTAVAVGSPAAIRKFVGKVDASGKAGVTSTGGFALNYDEVTNGTTLNTTELFEKK
jgi:hypothetical protein